MLVVGLGTQDSLADAKTFRTRHKVTTPRMFWDESFLSWAYYGVSSQPAGILFDAKGQVIQTWSGELDFAEIGKLI